MRRALTLLSLPILLWSAWDGVAPARLTGNRWATLRSRRQPGPDIGWDRYYAELIPYLPATGRIGLIQALPAGTTGEQREYYFLQYALAPRLIVPEGREEFLIAIGPPAALAGRIDPRGYEIVRRLDRDFVLYRRTRS